MPNRQYYSRRTGKNLADVKIDLPELLSLFKSMYSSFEAKGYFQQAFGYDCVDDGWVVGGLGSDIAGEMLIRIRKRNLYPIEEHCMNYSEEDIFDVIEFLFDYISHPIDGRYHSFSGCGWHYDTFDIEQGRKEWRERVNLFLCDYQEGYELSEDGEILALPETGLDTLLNAKLPLYDPENIEQRVHNATLKFRRYRSSPEDRRDAIRDLADVLEFLRPKLNTVITKKDDKDLFIIANGFGIRHHNDKQQVDYDKPIWYSWMFYYYLATIHASIRLIEKYGQEDTGS